MNMNAYTVHLYETDSLHFFTCSSTVSTLQSKLKNVKMTNDDLSTQVHKLSSTLYCFMKYHLRYIFSFISQQMIKDDAFM